jgi:large subunit ribosomal protein L21
LERGGGPIYAIVETGGKQYKVSQGQTLEVERLSASKGSTIELDRVLLLADGEKVTPGTPTVDGARVLAEVVEHGKGKKVIVFKYKPKVRYRKKTGHRQPFTRLAIKDSVLDSRREVKGNGS